MDKYILLVLFNVPFIIAGLVRATEKYHKKIISIFGLFIRIVFWLAVLFGLILFEPIYEFLARENLTDSPPLSIIDVVLITGVIFLFSLILRLYAKIDEQEKQITDLHEALSIENTMKSERK